MIYQVSLYGLHLWDFFEKKAKIVRKFYLIMIVYLYTINILNISEHIWTWAINMTERWGPASDE